MIEAQPSRTAHAVALLRAAHQVTDRPLVFEDELALPILGTRGPAAVQEYLPQSAAYIRLRGSVVARSRIAETTIALAAAKGVQQYVLLGAGLDSFGCRAPFAGVATYEVDHPATQAWKRHLLDEAGLAVPESLHFVPMDFERQDLHTELANAGFRFDAPAVFAMLGVAIYVERAALLATWSMVAAMPPGSALVFDYVEDPSGAPPEVARSYRAMAQRVAEAGEPWRTHFVPAELAGALRGLRFGSVRDRDSAALTAELFAGRNDGLRPGALTHVVVAEAVFFFRKKLLS